MNPNDIATKDYFAGLAMQALMSLEDIAHVYENPKSFAKMAYGMAEAMMKERDARQAKTDKL